VSKERLAEGGALAATLVGLPSDEALARARERGFDAEAVPHWVEAVTMDLRPNRVRLRLDESGRVVRAWAG